MPIDALVIGDSHSRALRSGCNANGLKIQGFSASGTNWIDQTLRFDRKRGLRSTTNRGMNRRFDKIAEAVGVENIFDTGAPALISLFNLGRLSGGFSWHNHHVPEEDDRDADALHVSPAFLRDYVLEQRRFQLGLMKRISVRSKVCIVAPPPINPSPASRAMRRILCESVRDMKLPLVDPLDFMEDGTVSLPPEHIHEDGRHGNDAYGTWLVGHMIAAGAIPKSGASDAA
ncbi:hypothetical protein [Primorskyibacter flagellatus]|uniref:SGNH hydrolase-type esterase domain-containing protein n=1 Tax=Primorskyibacter flagellatus TaxID=1387277 RepID=A0A1W2E303_9RHOB|nr:hypothetical protein [Primorskyibacter flagellatus]SMD04204.1 hypothetical protein SAMN06295998_12153 [Primorskyibacter flagellatus]